MAAADAVDWVAVTETAFRLSPNPQLGDADAGAVCSILIHEDTRDAITEVLRDE